MTPDFTARKTSSACLEISSSGPGLSLIPSWAITFVVSALICRQRASRRMVAQTRTKLPVWTVLLVLAGATMLCRAQAQSGGGFDSLAGRLTDTRSSPLEGVTIAPEALLTLPLSGRNASPQTAAEFPASASVEPGTPAPTSQADSASPAVETLNSAEIQTLPLSHRDWSSFLGNAPQQGRNEDDQPAAVRVGAPREITVDGVRLQSGFGNGSSSRGGAGLSTGESAIRELRPAGVAADLTNARASGLPTGVETQRGTDRLHGQAFVFDRQELWGARNPFTQWVQETAPASGSAIPVFTPEPYSPPDREAFWGAGIGGGTSPPSVLVWCARRILEKRSGSGDREASGRLFCAAGERSDAVAECATWFE